ncbi:hypothetical protein GGI22_007109, partial [Coemansia erecta]
MMSEHHRLLQMFEEYTKNLDPINVMPGTMDCLSVSLAHTCYGLAPILGFEELALTQAMDMRKMLECLNDMKATSLRTCYLPLYGCYPQGSGLIPAYSELLLLRMATTLFNIDEPWGEIAMLLAPTKIPDITQSLSTQLARSLCNLAVYFDAFSLNTTASEMSGAMATGMSPSLGSIGYRLMMCRFIRRPDADDLADILFDEQKSPAEAPDLAEVIGRTVHWVSDFVMLACSFIPPHVLYTQLSATLDRMCMFYLANGMVDRMVDAVRRITARQWLDVASVRFENPIDGKTAAQPPSLLAIIWSCVQRLLVSGRLTSTGSPSVLDSVRWQQTLALCCPESTVLAYIVMVQCIEPARKLVLVTLDNNGGSTGKYTVTLNRQGVSALQSLERTLTVDGLEEWATKKLLFVPHMYEADGRGGKSMERFAQTQFADAIELLSTSTRAEWTARLGLQGASLEFSEDDMRRVARLVEHYVENA